MGYWGLRANAAHGGAGTNLQTLVQFIRDMTAVDPWVAGMMSIHACIGPVGLLEAFGNSEQKDHLLVRLAGICAALELGTQLTGSRPTGHMHHLLTELGRAVAEDRFAPAADAERGIVAMVAPS